MDANQIVDQTECKEESQVTLDSKQWNIIIKDYDLLQVLGEGVYGQVVLGQHRVSGQLHAIKRIRNVFDTAYTAKQILREIKILRHLSKFSNSFVIKLHDIISGSQVDPDDEEADNKYANEILEPKVNQCFSDIFLILEYCNRDVTEMMNCVEPKHLSE